MRPSPPLPNPSELARRQRVTQRIWDDEAYHTSDEYSGRVGIPDVGNLDYDNDVPTRVLPGRLPLWSDDVDAPTLSDLRRSSPLATRKLAAGPFGGRPSFLHPPYGQSPTIARMMLLTVVIGMGVVLVGVSVAFGLGLLNVPGSTGDTPQNNTGPGTVGTDVATATLAPTATSTPLPAVAASFASQDTSLQGNWQPQYGSQGYIVVGDAQQLPAAVQVTPAHQQETVWQSSTSDPRALQKATDPTDRVAACWYADSSFTIDVNVSDGQTYQLALYFLDWDQQNRAEIINTVDPTTNALLDTRVVTSFTNGTYLVWNVRGHIDLQITAAPGTVNAVVSGVFIAPVATPGSTPVATPTDAATATPISSPDASPTETPVG
ncbi:MAG: hypothetical protein ACXWQ5_19295 [Ktedonobacterales bacterium]